MDLIGNRHEWEFVYSRERVHDAAQAQFDRHAERVIEWQKRREEAERDLDLELRHEAQKKLRHHREQCDAYRHWIEALSQGGEEWLHLKYDDIEFFQIGVESHDESE